MEAHKRELIVELSPTQFSWEFTMSPNIVLSSLGLLAIEVETLHFFWILPVFRGSFLKRRKLSWISLFKNVVVGSILFTRFSVGVLLGHFAISRWLFHYSCKNSLCSDWLKGHTFNNTHRNIYAIVTCPTKALLHSSCPMFAYVGIQLTKVYNLLEYVIYRVVLLT